MVWWVGRLETWFWLCSQGWAGFILIGAACLPLVCLLWAFSLYPLVSVWFCFFLSLIVGIFLFVERVGAISLEN